MLVCHSLEALHDRMRDRPQSVVTTGFFDGLHLGHQKLLEDLRGWAREVGGAPSVITFDPHPQEILRGVAPPSVLSLPHRLLLLEKYGVESTLVLQFNRDVASLSPEAFLEEFLLRGFGARRLLLGFDSTIGRARQGTFEYLRKRAPSLEIEVRRSEPLFLDGERISSTLVRRAVAHGDLDAVQRLTGRPYALLGKVARGDQRGRTLGFPTANLAVDVEVAPPGGVYFAEIDEVIDDGARSAEERREPRLRRHPALVNIGRRPTFVAGSAKDGDVDGIPRFSPGEDHIEAHVLDFEGDLYGASLEVHFLERRRAEKRFSGPEELVAQIRADEKAFRDWLRQRE